MKATVHAYVIVGAYGEERSAVCGESSDTICLGVRDAAGKYHQFESEAYHLEKWAEELGFGFRRSTHTIEV